MPRRDGAKSGEAGDAMTRRRDRYESAFDAGKPGVTAASYDLMLALYLLEKYVRNHELQRERVDIGTRGSYSLAQLLEIATDAQKNSIDPALRIYKRLQENEEAASTVKDAGMAASEGSGVLLDATWALWLTLNDKAILRRGMVSEARRILAERANEKTGGGAA